jgi:beta-lactamase class A
MRLLWVVTLSLSAFVAGTAQPEQASLSLESIAAEAEGKVGVCAQLLETGESIALNAAHHFPMQSVYKAPIAMAVLHMVDEGRLKLDQQCEVKESDMITEQQHSPIRDAHPRGTTMSVRELLRYAVSESDGTASDVLLRLVGGPTAVMTFLDAIGVNEMIVATTEMEMGQDDSAQYRSWATPCGAVEFLRALHDGCSISAESRNVLLGLMTDTETGQNRIKGQLPKGTLVAHKTGSSGTVNAIAAATNDIGIVTLPDGRHIALAVFVSDSRASYDKREKVIAWIARMVWDQWTSTNAKTEHRNAGKRLREERHWWKAGPACGLPKAASQGLRGLSQRSRTTPAIRGWHSSGQRPALDRPW